MKTQLIFFIFNCLIFSSLLAFSQTTEAKFKYDDKTYSTLWSKQFEDAKKKGLWDLCLRSVTFAKFTVKADGHVDNLDIYQDPDSPALLKKMLIDFVTSTDGMWLPRLVDGKPVESRTMILPFIYDLEICKTKTLNLSGNEILLTLMDKFHDKDDPHQMSCVFLKPVTAFAQQ